MCCTRQFNDGIASVKNDGVNTTVSLVAGGGSDVAPVQFEYSLNGTDFTPITLVTARDANGAFSAEWDVNPLLFGGTVTLRATGYKEIAATTKLDSVDQAGVELRGPAANVNSVEIDSTDSLRVFQQPYGGANSKHLAAVSGTTSAGDGNVAVSVRSAGVSSTMSAPVAEDGTWKGVLDIAGYSYGSGTTPVDQIVIGAERDTDDAESLTILKQAITDVTAEATEDGTAPAGGTAEVVITVLDQDGAPVVGAQVYDNADHSLVGYTDANGEVKDEAAPGTHSYYANASSNTAYEPGLDKKAADLEIATYTQTPSDFVTDSADGAAFDKDEYAAGDITVQVLDQKDRPMVQSRTVEYYWAVDAFAAGVADIRVPATGTSTATTGADGKAVIAFPTSAPSGEYKLFVGVAADANGNGGITNDAVADLTVKSGQAKLTAAPATPQGAIAGTDASVTYTLALEDGTALADRKIAVSFERGTESAPGDGVADAGIVDGTNIVLTKELTTNGTGAISVTVDDKAETEQGSERGGNLDVATAATPKIGNAGASLNDHVINFNSDKSVGSVALSDGVIVNDDEGVPMPGRPMKYTVTVLNDADTSANMGGKQVTVEFNAGKLFEVSGGNPVAESDTATYGDWKAAASQTTVTLDSNGVGTIIWGMEREQGFDDDGMVAGNIKVSLAGKSDDDSKVFYSGNDINAINPTTGQEISGGAVKPLNGGSVDLAKAAKQQSTVLPKAAAGQSVFFDLVATDQFGNRVKQDVAINDANSPAYFETNGLWSNTGAISQWAGQKPAVEAFSDEETDQTLRANWIAPRSTGESNSSTEVVSDATPETINWYEVDFAESTFTLTNDTVGNKAKVGAAVTETVIATDQEGQPISDLEVDFLRSGPNAQQGDVNSTDWTDADGKATYNFVGDRAGEAHVSAVVSKGSTPVAKLADTVTFESTVTPPPPGPGPVDPTNPMGVLKLSNNAKGDDNAFVNAPSIRQGCGREAVQGQGGRQQGPRGPEVRQRVRQRPLRGRRPSTATATRSTSPRSSAPPRPSRPGPTKSSIR